MRVSRWYVKGMKCKTSEDIAPEAALCHFHCIALTKGSHKSAKSLRVQKKTLPLDGEIGQMTLQWGVHVCMEGPATWDSELKSTGCKGLAVCHLWLM